VANANDLAVTLNVSWFCGENGRDDVAQVRVRNTHRSRSFDLGGIASRGLRGVGGFELVQGDDSPLRSGRVAVYQATGRLSNGGHMALVWVQGHPAARDGSRLSVNCGPDFGGMQFFGRTERSTCGEDDCSGDSDEDDGDWNDDDEDDEDE
jgi:hypothetical protein